MSFFFLLCLSSLVVPQESTGGIPVVDSNALPATGEGARGWVVQLSDNGVDMKILHESDGDGVKENKGEVVEELLGNMMHGSCVPSS